MTTGSLDLEALKELCEKATPGPWEARAEAAPGYMPHWGVGSAAWPRQCDVVYAHTDWEGYGNGSRQDDAEFIAAARSAVPALIAEVERLREVRTNVSNLAAECFEKGMRLQAIPEMKLVGNAYVGSGERIARILAAVDKEDHHSEHRRNVR